MVFYLNHPRTPKYFDGKISHGFVALFTSKSIMGIASGFMGLFLPIFLYEFFEGSIQSVATYFMFASVFYGLGLPYFIRFINKFGFRRSLQTSSVVGALYYLGFFILNHDNYLFLLPFMLIVIAMFRILHWVPYHVDFAKFAGKKNKGRGVGLMEATLSVIGVVTPILAGFIITRFDFNVLFVIGVILYMTSLIPFLTIPRTREKYSWGYAKTCRQFISRKNRKTMLAFMGVGAEAAVGGVIWPIFLFSIFEGNYFKVGAISTLVFLVTLILQLFVGNYIDKKRHKKKMLKYGSLLYSLGWILKIFIATAFQVFIIDSFHKLTRTFFTIPFDAITYEVAADQGHYIDEFTVLKELAINVGRVIMYALVIVLAIFISLSWLFVFAALASLAFNLIQTDDKVSTQNS